MKNRTGIDRPIIFRFTPYPGSNLYNECKKYGWEEPTSLEEWSDITLFNIKHIPWLTKQEIKIIDSIIELVRTAYPPLTQGIKTRSKN